MEHNATEENLNRVVKYIETRGLKTQINHGALLNVVAVIGDKSHINEENIAAMDGVREVKKIQEPYKLVSRMAHPEDTVIEFANGVKIGGRILIKAYVFRFEGRVMFYKDFLRFVSGKIPHAFYNAHPSARQKGNLLSRRA